MKKRIFLVTVVIFMMALCLLSGCGSTKILTKENKAEQMGSKDAGTDAKPKSKPAATEPAATEPAATEPATTEQQPFSMNHALFIGDSRTVGLSEYSGLEADFYASIGMSVYNIQKPVSVPKIGKVGIEELLSKKKYDTIYLMLGINELGYDFNKTLKKYEEVVSFIKEKQPDAYIFIQANLHVTKKRSGEDSIFNNKSINRFNEEISKLADGEKVFYLDVNFLFDDSEGNLSEDKSADEAHVFAKHYIEWGNWIKKESASKIKGE